MARKTYEPAEDDGCVVTAVQRDLGALPAAIRRTTEAATALALARELDRGRLLSTAPVARELRNTIDFLRAMAAAKDQTGDTVDDLAKRRANRRASSMN